MLLETKVPIFILLYFFFLNEHFRSLLPFLFCERSHIIPITFFSLNCQASWITNTELLNIQCFYLCQKMASGNNICQDITRFLYTCLRLIVIHIYRLCRRKEISSKFSKAAAWSQYRKAHIHLFILFLLLFQEGSSIVDEHILCSLW